MLFGWVEPDARNCFALAIFLLEVCPWYYIHVSILAACCSVLISKHLEIVLENIDDFIRLECFLNAVLNSVNKFVELLIQIATCR